MEASCNSSVCLGYSRLASPATCSASQHRTRHTEGGRAGGQEGAPRLANDRCSRYMKMAWLELCGPVWSTGRVRSITHHRPHATRHRWPPNYCMTSGGTAASRRRVSHAGRSGAVRRALAGREQRRWCARGRPGTPLLRLHRQRWYSTAHACMSESLSVREGAVECSACECCSVP
jgi:hypothetical protein